MPEYDEPKIKKELQEVYEKFVEDPSDKKNIERIERLDHEYESLVAINDYLVSRPVSRSMGEAIGYLSNLWLNSFEIDDEERISRAKRILENLQKQ